MRTVEVKSGDTLWSLAKEHLGDPYKWTRLYAVNELTILKAQRVRGRQKFIGPDWIFPGTVLVVPASRALSDKDQVKP